jgi:hypothetical protein
MNHFRNAISQARNLAVNERIVTTTQVRSLDAIVRTPMMRDPRSGKRIPALARLERRVARLYRQETGNFLTSINWSAVLQWLKDHIVQILTLIAAIIPFFM